jgi:hypothetical protein
MNAKPDPAPADDDGTGGVSFLGPGAAAGTDGDETGALAVGTPVTGGQVWDGRILRGNG